MSSFGDVVRKEESLRRDVTTGLDLPTLQKRVNEVVEGAAAAGATTVDDADRRVLEDAIKYWNSVLRAFDLPVTKASLLAPDDSEPADEGLEQISSESDLTDELEEAASKMRHRKIVGIDLGAVDLGGAKFQDCRFINCSFRKAKLRRTMFIYTRFEETRRRSEPTKYLLAQSVIFKDCVFDSMDLRRAKFDHAHLDSSVFRNCTMDQTTSFDHAYLVKAVLEDLDATGAVSFDNAFLCESRFTRCRLPGASFTDADLTGCIFEETVFDRADFRKADFSKANFRLGQNLAVNSFSEADLGRAVMRDATGVENCEWAKGEFSELEPEDQRFDLELRAAVDSDILESAKKSVRGDSRSRGAK